MKCNFGAKIDLHPLIPLMMMVGELCNYDAREPVIGALDEMFSSAKHRRACLVHVVYITICKLDH